MELRIRGMKDVNQKIENFGRCFRLLMGSGFDHSCDLLASTFLLWSYTFRRKSVLFRGTPCVVGGVSHAPTESLALSKAGGHAEPCPRY